MNTAVTEPDHDSEADPAAVSVPPAPAVEIDRLWARWGRVEAIRGLSFTVPTASVTAVLGPNGAGKSTLFNILTTLKAPNAGTIRVFGDDVTTRPKHVRARLGVVFQEPTLDRDLTVQRNLEMHASLYGIRRVVARARIHEMLTRGGLQDRAGDRVEKLSGGLARRVELVRALLHRPGILVLDEPTVGLDPHARHTFWAAVDAMRRRDGVTVVYSTHYMDETEHAHQVVVMKDGQCLTQGSPAQLKHQLPTGQIILRTNDNGRAAHELQRAGMAAVSVGERLIVTVADPEAGVPVVLSQLARARAPQTSIHVNSVALQMPTMDDVFLGLTGEGTLR